MSTEADEAEFSQNGVPELTALGKRIELLRIDRRISKRVLAQLAGTSRQQLWRVMTGKSELTSSLCARLAEVLEIDSRVLRDAAPELSGAQLRAVQPLARNGDGSTNGARSANGIASSGSPGWAARVPEPRLCETLEDYLLASDGLERTFETMPASDDGRRLKRALLNAIEDLAEQRSLKLPQAFFDLRRRIVNDER